MERKRGRIRVFEVRAELVRLRGILERRVKMRQENLSVSGNMEPWHEIQVSSDPETEPEVAVEYLGTDESKSTEMV